MRILKVIPARQWFNTRTGATASVTGAVPWSSDATRPDWQVRTVGYTWELANGTIGLGRRPATTFAEAERVMHSHNARFTR